MKSIAARLAAAVVIVGTLAIALFGNGPRQALADFDWSPLIVQWEARTPNLGGYPPGAVPVQGSSADVAAGSAVATLAGAAGKTTWITHFRCTGTGSTTAVGADVTVAGPTNSLIYIMGFASGATAINTPVDVVYSPPVQASAVNTAITVTMATGGSGNLHAACAAEGFQTAANP